MKKFLLLFFVFCSFLIYGQDNSTHVPKHSTYIVTINPASHVYNGDMKQLNSLEMLAQTNSWGSKYDYLYGTEDLGYHQQEGFAQLFRDIFSDSVATGIDTARKIFIFNDTPDSIHYWSYVFPIKNSNVFGQYVSTHLFEDKPEIKSGSGYSSISADKISLGWTNAYAIFLFSDYDYTYSSTDPNSQQYIQDSIVSAQLALQYYLRGTRDSLNMVAAIQAANDSIIPDSLRQKNKNNLVEEEKAMLEKLSKDTTPEENWTPDPLDYSGTQYDYENSDLEGHVRDSIMAGKSMRQLNALINLNYDLSVQSIPNFRMINAEVSDAVYWYNYGELMQQYYEQNMLRERDSYAYLGMGNDTSKIQNMWLGSYMVSLVHFEGNIAKMEQRSYFSPELQEHTTGLYTGRVNKKMFRYVKGENLLGFAAMSVDVEKMMKFYGSVYRETLNNSIAGNYQSYYMLMWDMLRVFIDDKTLYNLLDGKFLFAVTDLKPYTSSYVTYDYDENFNKTEVRKEKTEIRPEFIMIAGIGEKEKAAQIIAILERTAAIKKENNLYYVINTPGEYDLKMYLAIEKGMLIITNNEDLMLNHLKHGYGNKSMSKKLVKLGRKSPLVAYWDGQKSFQLIKENQTLPLSEEDRRSLDLLQQDVNNGLIIGRKPKDGVQRIDMQIELNDPQPGSKQTSFVRFFRLMNSLFLVQSNR